MSAAVVAWAVEALVASALLIALVLLARGPVRRTFGAPVAYALWALPVLRLALPPLPQGVRDSVAAPLSSSFVAPLTQVGQQVTIFIAPAAADGAAASPVLTTGTALALLWGLGAAAFLGWHLVAYIRFRQRLLARATTLELVDGVTVVESAAATGPLAFGIARRYVAFPRDFADRYDADERRLALAHELGHHARGDLVANWVALAVLALHWFNPLAWYAFRAFRADQEMANDARVLARLGRDARHAYACAIVKAAHGGAIAAACHLHTVDGLKGRLKMLGLNRISRTRALTGMAAVAATGIGALALTASGTQAAQSMRSTVEDAAAVALAQPIAQTVAAPARPAKDVRVEIVTDGKRRVYKGEEAAAWIAANPPPVPPAPPVPPMPSVPGVTPVPPIPPIPPVPATGPYVNTVVETRDGETRHVYVSDGSDHVAAMVPEVRSAKCGGDGERPVVMHDEQAGKRRVTICTDRIERTTARAAQARVQAEQARRIAMTSAVSAIRAARNTIRTSRNLSPEQRDHALDGLDREIERVEAEREEQ
ncbi:M56 family metallopeptidase [Sphingomonas radiodurans]|uniref:M56 family metallopeptidase n=1 Tax=Sphingomonas radiodurans TaxID=2890321 RepID=UPI001E522948|nr:M56 family metallopeptidase [Sphingomonas radiodurans]WBH15421.1 hypothetical protein LLW23_11275 [Sphingomonas radiodurans]